MDQKYYTWLAWGIGLLFFIGGFNALAHGSYFGGIFAIMAAIIVMPFTYWRMKLSREFSQFGHQRILRAVIAVVLYALAFAVTPQPIQAAQNNAVADLKPINVSTNNLTTPTSIFLTCPDKGFLESDLDYCVDLCLVNKSDAGINTEICQRICDQAERLDGSAAVTKSIEGYLCKKCGRC